MSLIGNRALESTYDMAVEAVSSDTWRFATMREEMTWDDGTGQLVFDSDAPDPSTPWTVLLGHAVAATPATIRVSASGRPEALVDAEAWRVAATDQMRATGLPERALAANARLLTPDRLLAALQRDFPGRPTGESWDREEQIAGVASVVQEVCIQGRDGRSVTYDCKGSLRSLDPTVRFTEGETHTQLRFDREGLVSVDSWYEATLSLVVRKGEQAGFKPVTGRRLVKRMEG